MHKNTVCIQVQSNYEYIDLKIAVANEISIWIYIEIDYGRI